MYIMAVRTNMLTNINQGMCYYLASSVKLAGIASALYINTNKYNHNEVFNLNNHMATQYCM